MRRRPTRALYSLKKIKDADDTRGALSSLLFLSLTLVRRQWGGGGGVRVLFGVFPLNFTCQDASSSYAP